jgi:hypothetical protein
MGRLKDISNALGMLLLCLASFSGNAAASVLCFGEDGHVAIESASLPVGERQESCSPPSYLGSADSDAAHCGACEDVPMAVSSQDIVRSTGHSDLDFAAGPAPVQIEPIALSLPPRPSFSPPRLAHSALTDARTVVLRL